MNKKSLLIILTYLFLGIIQSCDLNYCKDVDYYDFSRIDLIDRNSNIELDDSLNIKVQALNLDWMAENKFNFSIFSTCFALGCKQGFAGMKSPLSRIEITSDSDFNENYPANSKLNDFFSIHMCTSDDYYGRDLEYLRLNNIELGKFMNPQNGYSADLFITDRPSKDMEHRITIMLFKSNGDSIMSTTNLIKWKLQRYTTRAQK